MKNTISIHYDNSNFYLTLEVKKSILTKTILILFILLILTAYISIISTFEGSDVGSLFVPVSLIFVILFGYAVKTSLWNIYGRELIVVNNKTISFVRDYGFTETKLTSLHHDKLGIKFEYDNRFKDPRVGAIVFVNIREQDGLEEFLHKASIRINETNIESFRKEWQLMTYNNNNLPDHPYISLN